VPNRVAGVARPERSESAAWRGAERSEHRRVCLLPKCPFDSRRPAESGMSDSADCIFYYILYSCVFSCCLKAIKLAMQKAFWETEGQQANFG